MLVRLFAVALLFCLPALSPAGAVTFNFAAFADDIAATSGFERNWSDVAASGGISTIGSFSGRTLTRNGLGITASGSNADGTFADAFLDSSTRLGPAGLGVCSTGPSAGISSGCASGEGTAPEDDNVSGSRGGETLTLSFSRPVAFSLITFRDRIHQVLATGEVRINGSLVSILNGELARPSDLSRLAGLTDFDFTYAGDQFYVSKVVVAPVPLPGTLSLALAASGILCACARSRRA